MNDDSNNEFLEDEALDWVTGEPGHLTEDELRARLAADPEFRDDIEELAQAFSEMALHASPSMPSARLRDELMRRTSPTEQKDEKVVPVTMTRNSSRPGLREIFAWAAAFALGSFLWLSSKEAEDSREKVALLEQKLSASRELAQLEIEGLNSTIEDYQNGVAVVVWDQENQSGILKLERMPPLDPDKDYQLWVVDPSYENPVDGGVITVDAEGFARVDFKPKLEINSAEKFAISVERKGGVPVAEGAIIMINP